MARRRRQRRFQVPSAVTQLGLAWYGREDWERLRGIADDRCHAAREARARHRYGRSAPDRRPRFWLHRAGLRLAAFALRRRLSK